MKDLTNIQLERFGVSPRHGFLGDSFPLQRLTHAYYEPWEVVVDALPAYIATYEIRSKVQELPVLSTQYLKRRNEWQRAYVVLGFLTHAYIWGGETPSEHLPPQITCPFLVVADHLGLPLTATYSTLNLWNYRLKPGQCDLTEPTNLQSVTTFTGSRDEEWFYLISVAAEARGALLIIAMLECLQSVHEGDPVAVVAHLRTVTAGIRAIGKLLERMQEGCDPHIFYHHIRPLLSGSKGMEAAGLSQGVLYDEGDGEGHWRQYSGGSNAQSSLIQLFDVFLEVSHSAEGGPQQHSSCRQRSSRASSFIAEMRKYMPPEHRAFLEFVEQHRNLRDYATNPKVPEDVKEAYNNVISSLVDFRNIHLQIVARYIIAPSRSQTHLGQSRGLNLATISSVQQRSDRDIGSERSGLHGTGGTTLMPFLKRTRDETKKTALVPQLDAVSIAA